MINTNTGSPQGCVFSPILFTIYTNVCQINIDFVKLIKFAVDSCIEDLISTDDDENVYKESINSFTSWCDQNKLLLNTYKTKELIINLRTIKDPILPVVINDKVIEQVESQKYLSVIFDNTLNCEL